jgi:transposase InsO family protein
MTAYIESRRSIFGVEPTCRALGVAISTHYARLGRPPSRRAIRDAELVAEIRAAREGYRRVYGVRKTWKQLRRRGVTDAGRERVARLMRAEGLHGVQRGRKRRTTTPDETAVERARDLVNRDFTASRPDQLWVADLTYVRTWKGFAYLAFVLDVYARMLVGWQLATHMPSSVVCDALEMAVGLRQPARGGLGAHTDRGSQYTSLRYTDRLEEHGIAPSVGSRGDAYDNAMAEAWVATYKTELVAGRLLSFEHLEHETLRWISFYNHDRLHEELGDIPPAEYEQLMQASTPRPCGPPEASPPALDEGAPADLERNQETTKPSLHQTRGASARPDGVTRACQCHNGPYPPGHDKSAQRPRQ